MDINKIPDLINQISTAVEPLTKKLGVGAQYLYGLAVKECVIEGIESVVFLILCIAINVFIFKNFKDWSPPGHYDAPVRKIFAGITFGVCLIMSFVFIDCALKDLLNPQYQAIQSIICTVKGC